MKWNLYCRQETFTSGKRLLVPCFIVFFFQNQKPKLSCSQNQRKKTDFSPNRFYIVQFIVDRFILHMQKKFFTGYYEKIYIAILPDHEE